MHLKYALWDVCVVNWCKPWRYPEIMVVLRRKNEWIWIQICWECVFLAHLPNCRSLVVWSFLTNSTWNRPKKNFLERKHHDINYPFMDSIRIKNCIYIQLYTYMRICIQRCKYHIFTHIHIPFKINVNTYTSSKRQYQLLSYQAIQIYMSANSRRRYIWPNCNISPT